MTEHWRSSTEHETPMQRFYRGRWHYGSLWVLDIDRVICTPDRRFGMLIEEKHACAEERNWSLTQDLAHRLGWWAALLVFETDSGSPWDGNVTRVDATFVDPSGSTATVECMEFATFDQLVRNLFGKQAAA